MAPAPGVGPDAGDQDDGKHGVANPTFGSTSRALTDSNIKPPSEKGRPEHTGLPPPRGTRDTINLFSFGGSNGIFLSVLLFFFN